MEAARWDEGMEGEHDGWQDAGVEGVDAAPECKRRRFNDHRADFAVVSTIAGRLATPLYTPHAARQLARVCARVYADVMRVRVQHIREHLLCAGIVRTGRGTLPWCTRKRPSPSTKLLNAQGGLRMGPESTQCSDAPWAALRQRTARCM